MVDAFEPGGEFEVYDGQNRKVTIESFAQMHKLERESEQQARNGEGQPLRFRMLHQHRSNKEVNTFGPTPEERPTAESLRRFRPTEVDPDSVTLGPGVTDDSAAGLRD